VAIAALSTSTAGAQPCPPRAELGGDAAAVARVADELRQLGVDVVSRPNDPAVTEVPAFRGADGCAVVRAQVALDDSGGIAVAIRAARGSEGRVVSDAAFAAAWIDSWTREELDNALWAPPPAAHRAPELTAIVPPRDVPPRPPATSAWERVAIAAAYEQAWTDDDAAWTGISASACVRVGGFCLGGRARVAFDPERLHNLTAVKRDDVAVLATASYPIALGTMSIAPELGVGVGRLATSRVDASCQPAPPPGCDPMTPNCPMAPEPNTGCDPTMMSADGTDPKIHVGDNFSAATYAPRVSLALRVAVPVFEYVWLDGLAGVTYAPFGHAEPFAAGETMATDLAPPEQLALPGEPATGYVLGIGLRVGAR
jgi:hypothetical protein